jgi:hypothetical protein
MQELQEKSQSIKNVRREPATVAAILDKARVVINKGAQDGVTYGQRYTLYELSEQDILDPSTKQSLGRLETIKGTGSIVHVQDKLSILEAVNEFALIDLFNKSTVAPEFSNPKVGDKARPI